MSYPIRSVVTNICCGSTPDVKGYFKKHKAQIFDPLVWYFYYIKTTIITLDIIINGLHDPHTLP